MNSRIHVDFGRLHWIASSLRDLQTGSDSSTGLTLAPMCSDLVSSAAEAYAAGWSAARSMLDFTGSGLANGVEATLQDFIATEQAQLDAVTAALDTLEP